MRTRETSHAVRTQVLVTGRRRTPRNHSKLGRRRVGDAWHLIAETFLTHSEPVAPALALRSRMQEAFSVTHALAPPRQVPPGGAEGWRLQHGEHLLLRDAAENLVASLALDKPKRESHDEI